MGLFDDFAGDWGSIPDPVIGLPEGTHQCMISAMAMEDKDSGKYLTITYTCTDDASQYKGRNHKEFKRYVVGAPQNEQDVQAMSYIKQRLADLGVPPEKMSTITADDLVGMEVALTLVPQRNNPAYRNVTRVVPLNASNAVPTLPTDNSAASLTGDVSNPFA